MNGQGMKYRPLAHTEPDGRIAVYVGGAFQVIDQEAAQRLRDQLDQALAAVAEVYCVPRELQR